MPRGTAVSFSDALQDLLGQIGQLLAAPDADSDFIMQLRQMVMQRLQGQGQGQQPGSQPQAMAPGGMPGEMSRGPMPPPDMAQMAAAGQEAQAGAAAPPGGP